MIKINEALDIITNEIKCLETQTVNILSSLGKVLAEDIYSKDDLPPFNKSAMDGYAIKSKDTKHDVVTELEIKEMVRAGIYCEKELKSKEAFKIMTGAQVPEGADAVIQIEKTTMDGDKLILSDFVKKGCNIIKKGEEIKKGQIAMKKGKVIRPAEIGFLSSLGYSEIKVYKAPTIALLITGDELVDINEEIGKGKIRNSNEYSLTALINDSGANVLSLGIIPDNPKILKEKIESAFENADIVISSGGASVGDYDFVEDILREIGADIKFEKVAIKPGKPVVFATYKEKIFFGLPGNPLSIITAFEQFVKPAIYKMMGKEFSFKEIDIITRDKFKGKVGRLKHIYANIIKENGKYYAYDVVQTM